MPDDPDRSSGQRASTRFARELTPQQFNTWIRPLALRDAGQTATG